jgi:hypothetical protein
MTSAGAALDFLTTRTRLGLVVSVVVAGVGSVVVAGVGSVVVISCDVVGSVVVISCDVVGTVGDSLIGEKMQNLLLTD